MILSTLVSCANNESKVVLMYLKRDGMEVKEIIVFISQKYYGISALTLRDKFFFFYSL